jgi:hypothetical protein
LLPAFAAVFISVIYASGSRSGSGSLAKTRLRLVAREQLAAESATRRLLLKIYIGDGLPVQVFHHKAAVQFLDGPGRWEVALRHSSCGYSPNAIGWSAWQRK